MNASADRVAIVLGLLLATSLIPGCKAAESTQPAHAGSQYADVPPDPLTELAQLEGRMLELGLSPAPARTEAGVGGGEQEGVPTDAVVEEKSGEAGEAARMDERDTQQIDGTVQPAPPEPHVAPVPTSEQDNLGESRCVSVCELSEAICELEVRICTMAKNHGSDPTYDDACERAVDDCELSGDACDTCVE